MVAFEIDSARRRKSLYKLLAIESPLRLWVYYGGLDCQMVVGEIDPEYKIIVVAKQGYTVDLLNRSQQAFQPVTGDIVLPKMLGGYHARLAKIKE